AAIVGSVLAAERDAAQVAAELSERYEEIDLIYTISEILGQTIRLDEAADRILREVAGVVRARRATLLVHDRERGLLRIVAAQGMDVTDLEPIEVDDPCSVSARVFRDMRIVSYDPTDAQAVNPGCPEGRTYKGKAFLSVPVLYATPGERAKPIGVINLTDRLGADAFTAGDRKLVAAIANQIGAAIENATLVAKDLSQQRVRRELELAHDLQLKLLPSPLVIAARVDVAARCRQAESVGGDFYNLLNLPEDRVGVITWRPGAGVVCLFTDGVAEAEAEGERGGRFGEERVLGHVTRLTDRPARDMLEAIYADLAGFTGGAPAADDRTLVILKV